MSPPVIPGLPGPPGLLDFQNLQDLLDLQDSHLPTRSNSHIVQGLFLFLHVSTKFRLLSCWPRTPGGGGSGGRLLTPRAILNGVCVCVCARVCSVQRVLLIFIFVVASGRMFVQTFIYSSVDSRKYKHARKFCSLCFSFF